MLDEVVYRLSEVFEALGNAVRLKLVILLKETPASVSELAEELDRPIQTISRHLKKLRDKDLLQAESEGSRRVYSLKRPELVGRCLELRALISRGDET